jgi:hypothetical protein
MNWLFRQPSRVVFFSPFLQIHQNFKLRMASAFDPGSRASRPNSLKTPLFNFPPGPYHAVAGDPAKPLPYPCFMVAGLEPG